MSFTELSEQEVIRRNSLSELEKLGIEAYPAAEFPSNGTCGGHQGRVRRCCRSP